MADDEPIVEEPLADEPTETELLQEISNDIKYLIKCTVPNSMYVDWDYPTPDAS